MKGFDRNHGCWKIYGTTRNDLNNFFLFFSFLREREKEKLLALISPQELRSENEYA